MMGGSFVSVHLTVHMLDYSSTEDEKRLVM
jgi:hypothetical protein